MIPASFKEACVLVAPVEATSSFLRGSLLGPEAVAQELERIDLFDPELGRRIDAEGILTRIVLPESERGLGQAIAAIERETRTQLELDRFVLMLGGEHTVTLGALRAVHALWGPVGVVQLDAHGDLRSSYEGRAISHACVMRRAVDELGAALLGLGIRAICQEEAEFVSQTARVEHLNARRASTEREAIVRAVERLPEQLYLTIDMDVFDPAVAPGVGTPEAGGLGWHHVSDIIDIIASRRRIVAADVVELAPVIERERTVRLAARIALRVLLQSLGSSS